MFTLKRIYLAGTLILLIGYHILYLKHSIPYAAVIIPLLLLAPTAAIYSNNFSYILAGLVWVLSYPLFHFIYKIDTLDTVLPILIFNLLQAGFMAYKYFLADDRQSRKSELEEHENTRKRLAVEADRLSTIENELKVKEFAIVNLYEITKKMSEWLKFEDIFTVFIEFIKENFTFLKCDLLILGWESGTAKLDRSYSVWKNMEKALPAKAFNYEALIELMLKNPKELYLSRTDDEEALKALGMSARAGSLVSVPLMSENRMVGILVVASLPREELEKFLILSAQFALEIKKVLLYETVEKLAITDSLTGLYVRRYFSERLEEELHRSKRHKFKFAFLMIDIDDFKLCNDTYGHLVGDVVLKEMSRIIKEHLRAIDVVSRYGGEEFAVLLPETGPDGAILVAERLRKKIEENVFTAYDEKLKVTISTGVSIYPQDATEEKGLIEKADTALYTAKRSGKNIVCEYKK